MKKLPFVCLFLLISCLGSELSAQKSLRTRQIEDQALGADDLLVNGSPYSPLHPNAKGHPYFNSPAWQSLLLHMKGFTYAEVQGKLNLESGDLILMHRSPNGSQQVYQLNDQLIDSFHLGDQRFVHKDVIQHSPQGSGAFLEEIYQGRHVLYIHHSKRFIAKYYANAPHGFYSSLKSVRYLIKEGTLIKVSKKKQFLNAFPLHKKSIRQFMRTQKIPFPKANNQQLHHLLSFCDEF